MCRTKSQLAVLVSLLALLILASCSGGDGNNFPIDQGGQVLLASGAGVVFPAGTFPGPTEVTVTENVPAAARAATAFPADAGTLLGALQITVPVGVTLSHDIEVRVAVGSDWDATQGLIIFTFNAATSMWETTQAAASALRGTAAVGTVKDGKVVSFTAATQGQTGFDQVYGVFEGYSVDVGGGTTEPNNVPTVDLTADDTEVMPGDTVHLTATGTDADTTDTLAFTWQAAAGTLGTPATTGGTSTATWSAAAAGNYTVSVSVNDGHGGVATDSVAITVGTPPVPNEAPAFGAGDIAGDVATPVAGQKVWLTGVAATDPESATVTYAWSGPGAFAEPTNDEHGIKVYWTPDAAGSATVTLTASDGENDITKTFAITVAAMPTTFDFAGYATCLGCHADKGDETGGTGWFSTNHSSAIERNLSDPANAHAYRNPGCYACHALGWEPNDSGQGFIDINLTPQFRNIQCESCHGGGNPPGMGAGHKHAVWNPLQGMLFDDAEQTWVPDPDFDSTLGVGCGVCHEGARHGAVEQWAESGHGSFENTEDDGGTLVPAYQLTGASCAKCHNGKEYVRVQIDGEAAEDVVLTLDDLPEVYISCATCHNPHEAANEKQLRVDDATDVAIPRSDTDNVPTMVNGGWGNICLTCHNGRRDRGDYDGQITNGSAHFGPHGNPQGAMFFGLMGANLGAPTTYESSHPHRTWNENTCISCHMYRQPYISAAEPASFGHNFAPDFRNCNKCHTNWAADNEAGFWAWVEEFQTNDIQALLDEFVAAWPAAWKDVTDPANPVLVSAETSVGAGDGPVKDDPTGNAYREALWNYDLVLNDATHGVHNPTFTMDLLEKAIARVEQLNAMI